MKHLMIAVINYFDCVSNFIHADCWLKDRHCCENYSLINGLPSSVFPFCTMQLVDIRILGLQRNEDL